jgi:general stress protein 26
MEFSSEEERFLEENELGRLATICPDGMPHVVPVCYVYRSGSLWVATDYDTRKYRNIMSNAKVAFLVDVGFDSNRGMLIQGNAKIYARGPVFQEIYAIFHKKFNWVRADPWKEGEVPFIRIEPVQKACWGPGLE